jgi:DNA-binding NarL/FixJ family response regulator
LGQASNTSEALRACRTASWDVILLDLHLGGENGPLLLDRLQANWPARPVIIVSNRADSPTIRHCLIHGAWGFVAKDSVPDHLEPAIQSLLDGRTYLCRVATQAMAAYA